MAVDLSPAEIGDLVEWCGSLQDAAKAALDLPGYGDEIRAVGGRFLDDAGAIWFPSVPAEAEPLGWKLIYAAHAARRRDEPPRRRLGAPPRELELAAVAKAETRLKERRRIMRAGARPIGTLSYEAIALHAGLVSAKGRPNRDRVVQLEGLMALGWPLRKSHPDFPAKRGYVRLPTPEEAARLLRSR